MYFEIDYTMLIYCINSIKKKWRSRNVKNCPTIQPLHLQTTKQPVFFTLKKLNPEKGKCYCSKFPIIDWENYST